MSKHPLLSFEPVIWVLFGQGIMIGSMLLTGWLLVVGLAIPLGLVSAEALSFERAYALGSHPIGRVVLLGVVALPMWKGAHHMRHFFIDSGHGDKDGVIGTLCYLMAAAGSAAALVAVIRL
ncbi:MAG: fumarate reductase subunit D [Proteobacteria bacterium]|nr:fumarate reductase subunit D [Pseudomonadota bacterium]